MKLGEFLGLVNDPVGDVVSVYESTPTDPYHTLYEGVVEKCPQRLLDRKALSFYPAFVNGGPGLCVYLDGYDGLEECGMAITYVDWRNPHNRVPYSSDIREESHCTEFYEEGDEFLTFYNEDNGKYAVYYKLAHGGALCSLVEHFDTYSRLVDTDDGLSDELYQVIAKHAIDCGFPPTHPPINVGMTWRQLIDEVQKVPKEFLDTPAYAWRPDGGGTLAAVRGVRPWYVRYCDDTVPGPGSPDYNVYYIDNGFPNEE